MRSTRIILVLTIVLAALALNASVVPGAGNACTPSGNLRVVVELSTPESQPAAGLKMLLRYPTSNVSLPGIGEVASVKARVKDLPSGFLTSLNDQDGAFSVALASGTATAKSGKLFAVDFDRCAGAAVPTASDFACEVEEAVQDCGSPAGDVHCAVKLPSEGDKR